MFDFGEQISHLLQFGNPSFLHQALLLHSVMTCGGSDVNASVLDPLNSFQLSTPPPPPSFASHHLLTAQETSPDICKLLEVFSSCLLKANGKQQQTPMAIQPPPPRPSRATTVWPPVATGPLICGATTQSGGLQRPPRKRPVNVEHEAPTEIERKKLEKDEDEEVGVKDGEAERFSTPALNSLIEMTLSKTYQMGAVGEGSKPKTSQQDLGESRIGPVGSGTSVGLRAPKRRKTRTTFTSFQLAELEVYFGKQKYLSPADRDQIAGELGLSSTQVITWFQNRRAKKKRERAELERDILATKQNRDKAASFLFDLPLPLPTLSSSMGDQQQHSGSTLLPPSLSSLSLAPAVLDSSNSNASSFEASPEISSKSKFLLQSHQKLKKPPIWRPVSLEDEESKDANGE